MQRGGPNNSYIQRYITWGWVCLVCGYMMIDPHKCPKCKSKTIEAGKIRWINDLKKDQIKWKCLGCKYEWIPKIDKKNQHIIILT